jgi:hypothetical protein
MVVSALQRRFILNSKRINRLLKHYKHILSFRFDLNSLMTEPVVCTQSDVLIACNPPGFTVQPTASLGSRPY